jgi:hypothetical protein
VGNLARLSVLVVFMLVMIACGRVGERPAALPVDEFKEGQVWMYKTRPGEEDSRLKIGRIDYLGSAMFVHIQIVGLSMKNRESGEIVRVIKHVAVYAEELADSVLRLDDGPDPNFTRFDTYGFQAGLFGWDQYCYRRPVAEIVRVFEQRLSRRAS